MSERAFAARICDELSLLRDGGSPLDVLLKHAVESLHEESPRFDWTGIYELFPDRTLRLGPFVGAPTERVFVSVGSGVCGSAVAEKRNLNIPDVSKASDDLARSTTTRSELVVLIRRGEKIYAQIDIASDQLDAFDDATVAEVGQLADWLAEAYEQRFCAVG
jgi:GAF domain-containing protein